MRYRDLEPERFYSFPSSYSEEQKKNRIEKMIIEGKYSWSRKWDGNYAAFNVDEDNIKCITTRGISKVTGEYGRVEDKVFFFEELCKNFNKPTKIIGEIYISGGVDRDVGSILRCKPEKAKSIQDLFYYEESQKQIKFTAKDKRDIENNTFFNQKLMFRIFDVWALDGKDLTKTPWIERQALIPEIINRVNCPLIRGNKVFPLDDNFWEKVQSIFEDNGEGAVIVRNDALVEPGARTAWKTLKWKEHLDEDIDCICYGIEEPVMEYSGKSPESWKYWYNLKSEEYLEGFYYGEYIRGELNIIPVTKSFFMGFIGAIKIGVYDSKENIIPIGKVSSLTDEDKINIKKNWESYYLRPLTVTGMALNDDGEKIRIRHPVFKGWRDNDINPLKDCTLAKIKGQS